MKISLTDSETSAPIPSPAHVQKVDRVYGRLSRVPGIKVTVYLPPNLVGLKMSWVTVAIAVAALDSALLRILQGVFVHRVAIGDAHRAAGFAPRRSVCMGALALEFPP